MKPFAKPLQLRLFTLALTAFSVAVLALNGGSFAEASGLKFAPAGGIITSEFGFRDDPFTSKSKFHSGLDIAAPEGTPIFAPEAGKVAYSGVYGGYGNMVLVEHDREGLFTIYAHCQRNLVNEGDRVNAGQPIALMGSTGRSTGSHLHFEVHFNNRYINPVDYLLFLQNEQIANGKINNRDLREVQPSAPTPLPPAIGGPQHHLTVDDILND